MELYEGREPYIFISYARKDGERVTPYLEALVGAGYCVWYDAGIQAGADWLDTLLEKVENCEVFCPLFSEAFADSRYCYLETEWAHRKQKNIVPLHLEEMKQDSIPRLYQLLQGLQDIRLYKYPDAAQFAERLGREKAFAPCKAPEWHKTGQIQWRLSADGVLTIKRNEDLPEQYRYGSIPSYQYDPIHGGSTAPWMSHRQKILSVEIADDIDAIGNNAFEGCINLTDMRIGDSVRQIGLDAFNGCAILTTVRIPDGVRQIGDSAFSDCASLTTVRIPDGVTQIGDSAFKGCDSLTEVRIPDGVTQIGTDAFSGCYSLTEVRIPDGVRQIGDGTFQKCASLTDVHIPDGVTQIGNFAFWWCKRLTDIRIPDSVTKIGVFAFADCANLKSVEIPAGVTFVEGGMFSSFPEHTRVIRRGATGQ